MVSCPELSEADKSITEAGKLTWLFPARNYFWHFSLSDAFQLSSEDFDQP